MPNYVHSHDLGMAAGGWGPDWPDAYGWGWALFDGGSIVPAGNTNIAELNDPAVNNLFTQLEEATSDSAQNTIAGQIDKQVMADAAILPMVYAKALLYRPHEPDQRLRPDVLRDVRLRRRSGSSHNLVNSGKIEGR